MNHPKNKSSSNCYIIIPAYNEPDIINDTVNALHTLNKFNIIIIDDGSDNLINLNIGNDPNIYLIRHKVNLGQGAALQTGIEFALNLDASYIVTFDADGQHSASDIETLLKPLKSNEADITLGSRFLSPGLHNATARRKWLIKTARWINYLFTGLFLSDAHNGFRAMTANAAKKFNIKENRMAHATEMLLFIKENKLRYREVPVTINYTDYSRKKGQSSLNSIRIFFDLVLHKLFE